MLPAPQLGIHMALAFFWVLVGFFRINTIAKQLLLGLFQNGILMCQTRIFLRFYCAMVNDNTASLHKNSLWDGCQALLRCDHLKGTITMWQLS